MHLLSLIYTLVALYMYITRCYNDKHMYDNVSFFVSSHLERTSFCQLRSRLSTFCLVCRVHAISSCKFIWNIILYNMNRKVTIENNCLISICVVVLLVVSIDLCESQVKEIPIIYSTVSGAFAERICLKHGKYVPI